MNDSRLEDHESEARIELTLSHPETGRPTDQRLQLFARLTDKVGAFNSHEDIVIEYERWEAVIGFGHAKPGNLLPTDPDHYGTVDGAFSSMDFNEVVDRLPMRPGHVVDQNWHTMGTTGDPEGFEYSFQFSSSTWQSESNALTPVRRRFWRRTTKLSSKDAALAAAHAPLPLDAPPPPPPTPSEASQSRPRFTGIFSSCCSQAR